MSDPSGSSNDDRPTPGLEESLQQVTQAGRVAFSSAVDTTRAMRKLVAADLALARAALGRALVWVCVAIVFGATGWLLCTASLVAILVSLGLSWLTAISLAALLSLAITGFAAWRVQVYFDHAGLKATRRQLVRLGLMDDDKDDDEGTTAAGNAAEAGR